MNRLPGRLVLLGHPVSHSLSPAFQNAALRRAALPIRYELLDVAPDALDATLDALIAEDAWGNATIPHKEHVASRCARVSALAERVGAVNTFWIEDGALVGDNTDVGGFLALLATTAPDVDRANPVTVSPPAVASVRTPPSDPGATEVWRQATKSPHAVRPRSAPGAQPLRRETLPRPVARGFRW